MLNSLEAESGARRIYRASHLFVRTFQTLVMVVVLAVVFIWIFVNDFDPNLQRQLVPEFVRLPLPVSARATGFAVSLLPLALFLFGMVTLIRLFRLYERGVIFNADTVRCFRHLSRVLIAWCFVGILVDPLMSFGLTMHHPVGERMISVSFGSGDLTALLSGGVLAVIAWVMDEARKIKEDQDLTI